MKKILLIDDDQEVRTVLKAFVESLGCMTIEASNGQVALDIMYDNPKN